MSPIAQRAVSPRGRHHSCRPWLHSNTSTNEAAPALNTERELKKQRCRFVMTLSMTPCQWESNRVHMYVEIHVALFPWRVTIESFSHLLPDKSRPSTRASKVRRDTRCFGPGTEEALTVAVWVASPPRGRNQSIVYQETDSNRCSEPSTQEMHQTRRCQWPPPGYPPRTPGKLTCEYLD